MLTLPIKQEWFDMICRGEKREEYREATEYYRTRINSAIVADPNCKGQAYKIFPVKIRAGYNSKAPAAILMEAIKAVWKVKSASTSLHGGWKNAKTEPPPPNTDVEVYCKALGVTVGYHRPLMGEWLTDDHRTLRNVTHWRPIPPPPPEAEP